MTDDEGGTFETTEVVDPAQPAVENLTLNDEPTTESAPDATESESKTETGTEPTPQQPEIDTATIRYENVWKAKDEKARKGAVALWDDQTKGSMTQELKFKRLDMVCVVAYDGDRVVAVSTISEEVNQGLWCKIGFFRCIVHADYRKRGVATQLAKECKQVLTEYSKEHPAQRLHAMGMALTTKLLGERSQRPYWPELGMAVVGYNEHGMQMRLAWLDHVRLDY